MSRPFSLFLAVLLVAAASLIVAAQLKEKDLLPASIKEFLDGEQGALDELLTTLFEREIITPPPLRGPLDRPAGTLTRDGVLRETNRHRVQQGLSPLAANNLLNQAAQRKLADMFSRQYFDHVAPDGAGPTQMVEGAGYEYLRIGENLALGNFADDAELVEAWMDSPGHRANILSPGFTELGVAVEQGTIEDNHTWLAVQTFGLPASACPLPNTGLRTSFEQKQAQAQQTSSKLATEQQELEQHAGQLQTLAAETERLTEQGNAKIEEGNSSIEEGNRTYQETGSREQAQPYWDEGQRLQAEGQALIDQAKIKHSALTEQQEQLKTEQQTYDGQIAQLNGLSSELNAIADQINTQIRHYNECAESYQE